MLFKRKKKQPEPEAESCTDIEASAAPEQHLQEVDVEKVAKEVAEEITVYERQVKDKEKEVTDCPTVKIPNLKALSEELVLTQIDSELASLEVAEEDDENEDDNISAEEIIAEVQKTAESLGEEEIVVTQEPTAEESPIVDDSEPLDNSQTNDSTPEENVQEEIVEQPEQEKAVIAEESDEQKEPAKQKVNPLLQKKKKSTFRRKKEFKQKISLFANILMWGVSLLLFVFCLSNLYQQIGNPDKAVGFFNTGNAVVVSESMVPYLEKNDFIIYKATPIEKLAPQDVVVYKRASGDGHILIVHRLLSISDGYAITKGDNNAIQDEPFDADNIVGKVVVIVPQLGLLMDALSSVKGVAVLAILFVLFALSQFLYKKMTYKAWLKKIAMDKNERKAIQMFLDM